MSKSMRRLSPDGDENSVVVVQEHVEAQVVGEEVRGVKEGRAADIEPPAVILEPSHPDTKVEQVFVSEMSPEDRTTYSKGESPVKPKVMRARSQVRTKIFPPRPEGKQFRDY